MHAASLNAVEAETATSTATSRAAGAEAEPIDNATVVTAAGIATEMAVAQQRAESAERDAREHACRADEMEKRAAATADQVQALENVAGASVRAIDEKNREQAVRVVSINGH